MSHTPEGEHHQAMGDRLEINIADGSTACAAVAESTLMDELVSLFTPGAAPSHLLLGCHSETVSSGVPAQSHRSSETFSGLARAGKASSPAHKFSLASTVLQAFCCS